VVAKSPALLDGARLQPWLKAYVAETLKIVNEQAVRATLGSQGLEWVLLKALSVLASIPSCSSTSPAPVSNG